MRSWNATAAAPLCMKVRSQWCCSYIIADDDDNFVFIFG